MIYNHADCQLSGEGEVQTAQIAWFWEKHPALNCDSLRRGDGLLGYLVCLATWTWQTDESSLPGGADRLTRGKKVELQENKALPKWRGQSVRKTNHLSSCCLQTGQRVKMKFAPRHLIYEGRFLYQKWPFPVDLSKIMCVLWVGDFKIISPLHIK